MPDYLEKIDTSKTSEDKLRQAIVGCGMLYSVKLLRRYGYSFMDAKRIYNEVNPREGE